MDQSLDKKFSQNLQFGNFFGLKDVFEMPLVSSFLLGTSFIPTPLTPREKCVTLPASKWERAGVGLLLGLTFVGLRADFSLKPKWPWD